MTKGKVDFLKPEGKFGFIRSETGQRVHFFFRVLGKSLPPEDLRVGIEVEFDFVQAERGPTATRVEIAGIESKPVADVHETSTNGKSYRFLNPYNFVRFIHPVDRKNANGKPQTAFASAFLAAGITASSAERSSHINVDLLGKCPPPPHDRWVGLSGRIVCHAVAETPIFIADNEGVEPHSEKTEHKIYRQFEYHGEAAIPASSLRGMIRAVFEAITNSCFAHFTGDRRLSYHLPAGEAPYLVPGRVKHEKKDDPWELELLTGTTPLGIHQRPRGPQYAAWLRAWPRPVIGPSPEAKYPRDAYGKRPVIDFSKYVHKDKVWARLRQYRHPRAGFEFWNIEEIKRNEPPNQNDRPIFENVRPDEIIAEGYLCKTNQNIERKHDERFFFRVPENTTGPTSIDLPKSVREACEDLILDYQLRHEKEVEKRGRKNAALANYQEKVPALSRFVLNPKEKELSDGDLVYAWLEGPVSKPHVKFIAPVSVPRVSYENRVGDLLPTELHKCNSYEELCPACRLFGWVNDDEKATARKTPQAYAGRLRFQHARLLNKPTLMPQETLGILSTPKPTTTRFYLADKNGHPSRTLGLKGAEGIPLTDEEAGYDAFIRPGLEDGKEKEEYIPWRLLRGRKFYRHHDNGRMAQQVKLSDQNRTIRNALPKGAEFEFEIAFENLAKLELGALLWALEMPVSENESNFLFHRLGYGKPFGLGSLQIAIKAVRCLPHRKRYTSLGESGWDEIKPETWKTWRSQFEKSVAEKHGADEFGQLSNVLDLKALLGTPATDLPVHYPRPTKEFDPDEHPSYEWFVGNKRDKGPKFELPLAAEDTVGLPLVDKEGKWS